MNATMLPRIVPFIIFMFFIGVEELGRLLASKGLIVLSEQSIFYLYPAKALSAAFALFYFRKQYHEIDLHHLLNLRHLIASAICGATVFILWILIDFSYDFSGTSQGFNPFMLESRVVIILMIVMRFAGAVLIVPVMEELFWRSFLLRYIINQDFSKVTVGIYTWQSFLITSILFGLEHNLIIAGIIAGISYNLLLYRTRSITHCILAHALTNLLLGIYVLATRQWSFW